MKTFLNIFSGISTVLVLILIIILSSITISAEALKIVKNGFINIGRALYSEGRRTLRRRKNYVKVDRDRYFE